MTPSNLKTIKEKAYLAIRYFKLASFLAKEKSSTLIDTLLLNLGISTNALQFQKSPNKKRIVFVGQELNFRTIKHIKWLKETGQFEIVVILHQQSGRKDLNSTFYHHLVLFRNTVHLERIIKASKNIDLVFGFTSKPSYVEVAIKHFKAPTVFDAYDCMVMYHGTSSDLKWLSKELISEEYCFNNASGIMARSTENRLALKLYNIPKRPSIFFADYCDNEYFVNKALNLKDKNTTISVVYSGGLYGRHMKNKMSQGLTDFFDLIDNFEQQNIHFHIYPNPFQSIENYYDYVEASQKLTCLSIHSSVLQKNLTLELSKCHFGALPHFRTTSSKITNDKLERATSMKFYNYLEAGIPILVSSEMKYMAWIIKRYQIGIVFDKKDFSNIRNLILSYDYDLLKNNVLKVREKLSMHENLPRLLNFINKLIKK